MRLADRITYTSAFVLATLIPLGLFAASIAWALAPFLCGKPDFWPFLGWDIVTLWLWLGSALRSGRLTYFCNGYEAPRIYQIVARWDSFRWRALRKLGQGRGLPVVRWLLLVAGNFRVLKRVPGNTLSLKIAKGVFWTFLVATAAAFSVCFLESWLVTGIVLSPLSVYVSVPGTLAPMLLYFHWACPHIPKRPALDTDDEPPTGGSNVLALLPPAPPRTGPAYELEPRNENPRRRIGHLISRS